MGMLFHLNLEGNVYSCKHCRTHLALYQDIVSKTFHCRTGKAYLFTNVVNVSVGEKEDRFMMTGLHTVADIFCVGCGSVVGWKYVRDYDTVLQTSWYFLLSCSYSTGAFQETAHEKDQKYKEGKSVLERYKMAGPDGNSYYINNEVHVGGSDDE